MPVLSFHTPPLGVVEERGKQPEKGIRERQCLYKPKSKAA